MVLNYMMMLLTSLLLDYSLAHSPRNFRNIAQFAPRYQPVVLSDSDSPTATTSCGPLEGNWEVVTGGDKIASFRGIPFGAPPVDKLRWMPPQPAKCWSGTLNAKKDGPACYQMKNYHSVPESEDCLSLNVFTKNLPTKNNGSKALLPVFVWIYGGSIVDGYASSYGPNENILHYGDYVLVAMNYRLNAFGFLVTKELSAVDPRGVSGNVGIIDQQLALKWIQKEISNFGGDPKKVTLYGQSSGGTSIFALLGSPGSKGLFHAAISLSGSANISMSQAQAEIVQRPFVENTGCSTKSDVLACLYDLTPAKIVAALPPNWSVAPEFPEHPAGQGGVGLVIADGITIPKPVEQSLEEGLIDVPIILQNTAQEFWRDGGSNPGSNLTRTQYLEYLNKNFAEWKDPIATSQGVFELYPDITINEADEPLAWETTISDTSFTCGNAYLAIKAGVGFKSPVYVSVVIQGPSTGKARYPYHGWDWQAAANIFRNKYTPSEEDLAFGKVIRKSWFELALHGKIPLADGWTAINVHPSFPKSYYTNLPASPKTISYLDFRTRQCDGFEELGIGQSFWCIN